MVMEVDGVLLVIIDFLSLCLLDGMVSAIILLHSFYIARLLIKLY